MFSASSRRTLPQSTVTFIVTVTCFGIALFLIASTVVLALIPVFISNRSVTPNPNVLKSKEVVMSMEVEGNDTGDLCNYVNGTFDDAGKDLIKAKLLAMLPSNIVRDLDISSVSIAYKPPSRRKRFPLSKRASYYNQAIIIVIRFFIIYNPTCLYHCQFDKNSILRTTLQSMPLSTFDFYGLKIYKYGSFYQIAQRIQCVQVTYVSLILPGVGPITQTYPAITATAAPMLTSTMPVVVTTADLIG